MILNFLLYLLAFFGIWFGAGLAISSVEKLSSKLKVSSFAVSFLLLGFFTSISELSVGVNSLIQNDPEIFVGNLIGASLVLFLLIVPLLAVTGNKIEINKELRGFNLFASLIVIAAPVVLAIDGVVDQLDSIVAVILYFALVISVQSQKGILEKVSEIKQMSALTIGRELLKILVGVAIIFIASKFIVEETLYFSRLLQVSPFLISLLLIGIGTNIPELSLVVRSMFLKSNQVAFGDYVGSAAFNTFLLGFLSLWYGKPIMLDNNYLISLLFFLVGLSLFYLFSYTKNSISRREGIILLGIYGVFVVVQLFLH